MEQSVKFTPSGFIRTLSILHIALLAGPTLIGGIFYFQSKETHFSFNDTEDVFLIVVPVFAISGLFLSDFIFRQLIKKIPSKDSLRQKLARYQSASIIKYALLEGPAIFGAVAFFNTQNLAYLLIAGILVLYLALQYPTKDKIERNLNLRGEEKSQFNRPNQPLD
ncbi:hypothetical protein [Flagellimonas nanhaiensis]|uniref:Uncharacterized protein n=1 Tax=Flagellimonas nanhaiensis TaxID=2292706 RepID=A0A371JNQ9_9FLAO|nr:hypothetical protein [Allomuricauda nanhaiensis]RDY58879.1 hypothetical protein DX873_14565 [Allomuricauda nanhaiensis]